MEKQKLLTFVLIGALVFSVLFMSGCVRRGRVQTTTTQPIQTTTTQPPQTTTTQPLQTTTTQPPREIAGLKTCAELNGYECDVGEECEGEWLDAADSFSCCSEECKEETLTLEPFDTGPENEELGDVL